MARTNPNDNPCPAVADGALLLNQPATHAQLSQAVQWLQQGRGPVVWDGVLILRGDLNHLHCDVMDPERGMHRCAAEYAVLVENARRRWAQSTWAVRLPPAQTQSWSVIGPDGELLWRASVDHPGESG